LPEIVNNDVKISYNTFGTREGKESIVFLPGAGNDSAVWHKQIPVFSKDYFVITVDNRGSGKSDTPEYPYTADMLAGDVEAVLNNEELDSVNLVGFSMGGLIAQRFVNNNPGRVKKLILMNCSLGAGNESTVLPAKEVINMFLFAAALTDEDACKNAMDYNFGPDFKIREPKLYERYFNQTMANRKGIRHQIAIMVSDKPLVDDYAAITMPLLYILSLDDPVTPKENGKYIKKFFPGARVEYVKGYHASMINESSTVNSLINEFLRK
jgi:pimeloyl-ACP methyl ester carboxylesterase